MRTIKFKGKDVRTGEWHYGYFWVAPDETHFIKERIASTHYADFQVIPGTVGQYIGFEDKNDKEIYEGDIQVSGGIIRGKSIPQEVKYGIWNCGCCGDICGYDIDRSIDNEDEDEDNTVEIIGNIHDNHDLIPKGAGE